MRPEFTSSSTVSSSSTPSPGRGSLPSVAGVMLAIVCLTLILALPLAANDLSGFLPEQGEGKVALSFTQESYDAFWRGTQKVPTPGVLGEITTASASLWMTWGLTDRLALIVDVAHVEVDGDGSGGLADSGPQNLSLLVAYRLAQYSSGTTSQSLVGAIGGRGPLESYVANAPVARGDETTDTLLRLVYLLRSGRFYWSQQIGYDLRGGDAPDGIPLYTELGWTTGRLTWVAWYSQYLADSGTDIGEAGFTFPSNREEVERVGGKAIFEFSPKWCGVLGGFTTLDGRNTGDATGASLALVRKF